MPDKSFDAWPVFTVLGGLLAIGSFLSVRWEYVPTAIVILAIAELTRVVTLCLKELIELNKNR